MLLIGIDWPADLLWQVNGKYVHNAWRIPTDLLRMNNNTFPIVITVKR